MKKTLYILRHGETEFNRRRIVQGSGVDIGLNDVGRRQAHAFFERYGHIRFDVVITSALRRTHETVKPFLDLGLPWEQYTELNEIGWGEHEGKVSTPEMILEYQELIARWQSGDLRAALSGGETAEQMVARLSRFVEWVKVRSEQTLLICSHGRAMRALMCLLRDEDLRRMENFRHDNTGLYKIGLHDGRFVFELENDTSHLELSRAYPSGPGASG